MPRRLDEDRGAQAVEFALLFVFVVGPLLYGMIGAGMALYQQISVTQLAREAARVQAICLSSGSDCQTSAEARAVFSYWGPTPTWTWASNTCTATSGYAANVTVTVSVSAAVSMPSFFPLSTISGTATAPCGG